MFGKQALNAGLKFMFDSGSDVPIEFIMVDSVMVGSMILIAVAKELLRDDLIVCWSRKDFCFVI